MKTISNNSDNIGDIENAIIIKGIEAESDNDLNVPEGTIIYDDSFYIPQIITKKKVPQKKYINNKTNTKKNDNQLTSLIKQDTRWHNTSHRIKKGENLWSIAKKYNSDYKIIISINDVNQPDRLNPGNVILVPNRIGINHKIEKNETLTELARRYKIGKDKIITHNRIKNNLLIEGKYIFIPDAAEPETKTIEVEVAVKDNKKSDLAASEDEYEKEEGNTRSEKTAVNLKPDFIWPVKGMITSSFGKRINPIDNKSRFHCGLDIGVEIGTEVRASAEGEIIFSGWKKAYGRVVILKHSDGYITVYAHNKTNLVNTGDNIKQGDVLATSGISGAVTGPHLHFEIRKYLTPLNPLRFLN